MKNPYSYDFILLPTISIIFKWNFSGLWNHTKTNKQYRKIPLHISQYISSRPNMSINLDIFKLFAFLQINIGRNIWDKLQLRFPFYFPAMQEQHLNNNTKKTSGKQFKKDTIRQQNTVLTDINVKVWCKQWWWRWSMFCQITVYEDWNDGFLERYQI